MEITVFGNSLCKCDIPVPSSTSARSRAWSSVAKGDALPLIFLLYLTLPCAATDSSLLEANSLSMSRSSVFETLLSCNKTECTYLLSEVFCSCMAVAL
jgi:hypothetical protein